MNKLVDFERPTNALYSGLPLRHITELPIYGVPVRYESNSAAAIATIEDAFGAWRVLRKHPELVAAEGVRVRLIVHDGDEGAARHAPTIWRLPDADRLFVRTPGSLGVVDMGRGDAVAYITPALLADRAHAQYGMLGCMTLPLVEVQGRYPVHAGMVGRGGVAILLAGPSNTGKSTLLFEAHRCGLRALADDCAHIQLRPTFRVWGECPEQVYLPAEAKQHFPELRDVPTVLASGIEKVLVRFRTGVSSDPATPPVTTRVGVCLLARTGGRAALATASADEVKAFLRKGLDMQRLMCGVGFDDALVRLSADGGWKLSLSDDPADALPFIDEMLTVLERTARAPALCSSAN